jgi:O-methyltransferase involved in polyketide biosynthesis
MTALVGALVRAQHHAYDPHRILDDGLAERLLTATEREALESVFLAGWGRHCDTARASTSSSVQGWTRSPSVARTCGPR